MTRTRRAGMVHRRVTAELPPTQAVLALGSCATGLPRHRKSSAREGAGAQGLQQCKGAGYRDARTQDFKGAR